MKIKLSIIGLITGFINGLFGAAGGTVLVPLMEKYLKTEVHKAHATALFVIFPLSVLSAVIYLTKTHIDLNVLLYVSLGGIFGGGIGALLLKRFSGKTIVKIFAVALIVAGLRPVL